METRSVEAISPTHDFGDAERRVEAGEIERDGEAYDRGWLSIRYARDVLGYDPPGQRRAVGRATRGDVVLSVSSHG